MAEWVDFNEVKQKVSMADILGYYGLLGQLKPQKGGDELVGLCPFHQERRGSFHVSVSKNAWQCFGCKRHGNVLDFVAAKEGTDIRQAAVLIAGWFQIHGEPAESVALQQPRGASGRRQRRRSRVESRSKPDQGGDVGGHVHVDGGGVAGTVGDDVARSGGSKVATGDVQVNKPLTFELKNLDGKHPYLTERGLKKETIEHFGLGYYSGRGLMKGRVAIPIHNERGELVAYAGRWPGEPPEDTERYLMPPGFQKSHLVFNLHRAGELAKEEGLILVEGFFAVFKLWQAGFSNAVALMGSSLSERQRELLVAFLGPQGRIALLFDGDDAGRACQEQCLRELSRHLFVKVVELPEGGQPDHLDEKQIRQLLAG